MAEQFATSLNETKHIDRLPLPSPVKSLLDYYEQVIAVPHVVDMGPTTPLTPFYPEDRPPSALREYKVYYPPSLVEAYRIACNKYDKAFMQIVQSHKDWESDYRYAPHTFAYQVDGPAYPGEFLELAASENPEVLAEFIILRAFEFENNIAAYGLNNRLWPDGTTNQTWHTAIDQLRQKTGKKIAVLAGTEQKLTEMLKSELATDRDHIPPEEVVRALTGFDRFMGPIDLQMHFLERSGQSSDYLYYGRTSEPKSWLRSPDGQVYDGFLADPDVLRYIRAFAITHNFDNTTLPANSSKVITDTKEPLVAIGAAYPFTQIGDIYSDEFIGHLKDQGINISALAEGRLTPSQRNKLGAIAQKFPHDQLLSPDFIQHLIARGADPGLIATGNQNLRAKPIKLHYGVYGHVIGKANRSSFLNELILQTLTRGQYVIQPELKNLKIVNNNRPEEAFIAIDRVFFVRGAGGELVPMESCRSLMPLNSEDGKKNSVHEGPNTRCARIVT
mgnify:CR=1 FL=1